MRSEKEKESLKKTNKFLRARGICTRCGKEYAEPGKSTCALCLEKFRTYDMVRYSNPELHMKELEYKKERYEKLKEDSICPYCGKRKRFTFNGKTYVSCYECYIRRKREKSEYLRKTKKFYREIGACLKCGGECENGKKLCAFHLEELRRAGLKGNQVMLEKKKEIGHPWDMDERIRIDSLRAKNESESLEKSIHQ